MRTKTMEEKQADLYRKAVIDSIAKDLPGLTYKEFQVELHCRLTRSMYRADFVNFTSNSKE